MEVFLMKKMKKMKKQFLSLFVLLCMIISMFPTTALAANIDVSGKVTVDRVYEEPTCADNLYYGEVNVNGSATESKTRLTHTVLPLIQWQYGNNTYQIIPSAYKYYVCNINDPNHILEGIEGSEGSSTLSGWPGTYKCYQTVVTTDGVTNGTATFDIDLAYQFSRLNSSIGWTYASNWGGRTLHFTIKQTVAYTVTYTDGVEDEEVFADDVHENLSSGVATPAFEGTPTRTGYVFKGWEPSVAEKVTGDVTYVAVWEKAKDNNGDTKPGDTKPGDTKPGNTKPGNTKPGNTKPNTTTNSSTKAGTSARSPKTSDTANLALWMALLVVSGGSMVINKKKKYNR